MLKYAPTSLKIAVVQFYVDTMNYCYTTGIVNYNMNVVYSCCCLHHLFCLNKVLLHELVVFIEAIEAADGVETTVVSGIILIDPV